MKRRKTPEEARAQHARLNALIQSPRSTGERFNALTQRQASWTRARRLNAIDRGLRDYEGAEGDATAALVAALEMFLVQYDGQGTERRTRPEIRAARAALALAGAGARAQ